MTSSLGKGIGRPAASRSGPSRRGRALTQARISRWSCDVPIALVPSGFFSGRGNSTRRSAGVCGERGADFLLLGEDDGRLPVMDREAAPGLEDLGHVVDEHGAGPALAVLTGVLVVVEAGETE